MSKRKLTSIVILAFNQLDYTKLCIESIYRYTTLPFELILVDDASVDGRHAESLLAYADCLLMLGELDAAEKHYKKALMLKTPCVSASTGLQIIEQINSKPELRKFIRDNGLAWGASPEEIRYAKTTISKFHPDYMKNVGKFDGQLDNFIKVTQEERWDEKTHVMV